MWLDLSKRSCSNCGHSMDNNLNGELCIKYCGGRNEWIPVRDIREGTYSGVIVDFTGGNGGVVLEQVNNSRKVGHTGYYWDMGSFTKLSSDQYKQYLPVDDKIKLNKAHSAVKENNTMFKVGDKVMWRDLETVVMGTRDGGAWVLIQKYDGSGHTGCGYIMDDGIHTRDCRFEDVYWVNSKSLTHIKNENKYEVTDKAMTGKSVAEAGACPEELEIFIDEFGYNKAIVYDEKRFLKGNGWVSFLLDKGFLKQVEVKPVTYQVSSGSRINLNGVEYVLCQVGPGAHLFIGVKSHNRLIDTHIKVGSYTKEELFTLLEEGEGSIIYLDGVEVK